MQGLGGFLPSFLSVTNSLHVGLPTRAQGPGLTFPCYRDSARACDWTQPPLAMAPAVGVGRGESQAGKKQGQEGVDFEQMGHFSWDQLLCAFPHHTPRASHPGESWGKVLNLRSKGFN